MIHPVTFWQGGFLVLGFKEYKLKLKIMKTLKLRNYLLFTLLALFVSCNNRQKEKEDSKEEPKQESNENKWEDNNFPVVSFNEILFSENVKNKKGDGATLFVDFTMKNNTPHKITSFELRYYAKAVFKDGSFEYYPHSSFVNDKENDYERFDDVTYGLKETIPKDEIWEPGTTRDFTLVVFNTYGIGWLEYNIDKRVFERTPNLFLLLYRYNAISVDKEYEKVMPYNMLPQWKEYQRKLGLR